MISYYGKMRKWHVSDLKNLNYENSDFNAPQRLSIRKYMTVECLFRKMLIEIVYLELACGQILAK